MKRYIVLVLVCLMFFSLPALAGEKVIEKEHKGNNGNGNGQVVVEVKPRPQVNVHVNWVDDYHTSKQFALDLYKYYGNPALGLKFQTSQDVFTTLNFEFDGYRDDLLMSVGGFYRIPKQVILWHFYVGGEYSFTPETLRGCPYVLVGTDFLIFFSEAKYPILSNTGSVYRGGLRFYF